MKFIAALPIAIAATLTTGCGSSTETAAPSTPPPPTTSAAAPSTKPVSQRNNLIKQVGEEVATGKANEPPVLRWRITSLTVDAPCSRTDATPATNGHFIVADIELETTPAFVSAAMPGGMHPANNWGIVDADGVTQPRSFTDAAVRCHQPDWPADITPGSKYKFRITLDSRTPTGVLTYVPAGWGDAGGWEWVY